MTVNAKSSNVVTNWSEHPKSRLMTDKGRIVHHVEGREVQTSEGQLYDVTQDGKLSEDGMVCPAIGRLSAELVDVTEQLRRAWLEEQKRGADYVNPHEERQEQRRERYEDRAARARAEGSATIQRAHNMAPNPPDQPILIGHHSERRHRRTLEKMDNLYRHAFVECAGKASHYDSKAEGVGRGGVSGDDPEAVRKLLEQLQGRIKSQETMKACNAAIRKNKNKAEEVQLAALVALGQTEENARTLLKGDFCGRIGFASYSLQNNNAQIQRLKTRIADLQAVREEVKEVEEEHEGFAMKIDGEENRIMFIFEGKPEDAIRTQLKARAFKWSPSRGAWVRKITANALADAERLKAVLIELTK